MGALACRGVGEGRVVCKGGDACGVADVELLDDRLVDIGAVAQGIEPIIDQQLSMTWLVSEGLRQPTGIRQPCLEWYCSTMELAYRVVAHRNFSDSDSGGACNAQHIEDALSIRMGPGCRCGVYGI